MTTEEKTKLIKAWAAMNVLCGVVESSEPETSFPKGRLVTAKKLSIEVYSILEDLLHGTKG